jgi:uncharacterized protein
MKRVVVGAVVVVGSLSLAAPVWAHVSVNPPEATKGSYANLAFRVPTERNDKSTTQVEIAFPAAHPIENISTRPLSGWSVEVSRDGDVVSRITWTAAGPDDAIGPGEFEEFEVLAGPLPKDVDVLEFKVLQTYSDGGVVRWIDETPASGEEPEHPAAVLSLVEGDADHHGATPTTAPAEDDEGDGDVTARGLGAAGILIGALGMLVGLRRRGTPAA